MNRPDQPCFSATRRGLMHYRRSAEKSRRNRFPRPGVASDFTVGFLIAPTRGSNRRGCRCACRASRVPHRPYEGQQQPVLIGLVVRVLVFLIAPTRGSNCWAWWVWQSPDRVPHRPYEGQQQFEAAEEGGPVDGSSSPLRGAATCDGPFRSAYCR